VTAGPPRERGAVLDMAWTIRGGAVRLSLHTAEPLGDYDVQRLAVVVREIESLVHLLDTTQEAGLQQAVDILAAD
jgi:hypothetical protein